MILRFFLITNLCLLPFLSFSQDVGTKNLDIGGRIGLSFTFGKPVNRVGIVINTYYFNEYIQINSNINLYYNFTTFGPSKKGWEAQSSLGLLGLFGPKDLKPNPFLSPFGNQSQRHYSLAYVFTYYSDNMKTTQGAGTIAMQFGKFTIACENDVFGTTKGEDKFRTGGLSLSYHRGSQLWHLKTILWTGNTRGNSKAVHDTDYPSRWGYKDISKCQYGKFSHGILSMQLDLALPYAQTLQMGAGIDAEQIRHFFQNKLIHDMPFIPKSWLKVKNLHCPMLCPDGLPYLYGADQKVCSPNIFVALGLNSGQFY